MQRFRFWGSDSRGGGKHCVESDPLMSETYCKGLSTVNVTGNCSRLLKRKASSIEDCSDEDFRSTFGTNKRTKAEFSVATPPETPAVTRKEYFDSPSAQTTSGVMEQVVDVIQFQFGLEILTKHDELRLIDQELAKCQVALEQLRRCHLMPYPTNCPTPEQMLNISDGKGPAVQIRPGEPAPQWAAPFGVVEGPYARHYAKWLIPDPKFDGALPDWQGMTGAARSAAEGRTTRNSFTDGTIGKRVSRGVTGQKLQAIPAGYPQPKEKAGPCVLKRADGETVKLKCIDCHRENFSSTQGFINHCRIAHRRDFKSHEEAAVHCGHPITAGEGGSIRGEELSSSGSSASGLVHPLARKDAMSDQEAYATIHSRIQESLKLYHQGKLTGVESIPGATSPTPSANDKKPSKSFVGASATPYLTTLMHGRNSKLNLSEHVEDAKMKMDLDEAFQLGYESEEDEDMVTSPNKVSAVARVPAMRVPARTTSPLPSETGPSGSTARPPHLNSVPPAPIVPSPDPCMKDDDETSIDDHDMIDLSPNTSASNNAPSLVSDVSDDGEYDDSDDDGASSTSTSDVAEINIEDPEVQDHLGPRGIRHHRGSASTSNGESKHVTFVGLNGNAKGRRKPKM